MQFNLLRERSFITSAGGGFGVGYREKKFNTPNSKQKKQTPPPPTRKNKKKKLNMTS